ncbi:bacteriocin [Dolosigranulum pigrum]|jgi:hypothetical protein|uniref:bacteriocin n=1 Tax=Dolosigranulum pigrum TaxID=29394 RepID=UPI000DD9FFF1|nr:bacteriocin [Dolosigranulum pigrum]QJS97562.1 bacteriocin [Dolosigranulum pigrum]QTJ37358.1 bacteriocin [Dolosigranulum pigrum]QTJ42531.1 bacteriocin [Dolosigranulum pigrum]QTJ45926.1 bacteriocin [Dolosigranulum pigrum]QTJ49328.1 bacteriocin [Dolosigranulum pigrum]
MKELNREVKIELTNEELKEVTGGQTRALLPTPTFPEFADFVCGIADGFAGEDNGGC